MSEARGVVLAAAAGFGATIVEYTPSEIKAAIAGYGGATKTQIMRMCANLLNVKLDDAVDDSVDACAVAICHHHRLGLGANAVALRGKKTTPGLEAAIAAARQKAKT